MDRKLCSTTPRLASCASDGQQRLAGALRSPSTAFGPLCGHPGAVGGWRPLGRSAPQAWRRIRARCRPREDLVAQEAAWGGASAGAVAANLDHCAKFWCRFRPNFGRAWPTSAHRPNSAQIWPISPNVRANPAQTQATSTGIVPISAEITKDSAKLGRVRPDLARFVQLHSKKLHNPRPGTLFEQRSL